MWQNENGMCVSFFERSVKKFNILPGGGGWILFNVIEMFKLCKSFKSSSGPI